MSQKDARNNDTFEGLIGGWRRQMLRALLFAGLVAPLSAGAAVSVSKNFNAQGTSNPVTQVNQGDVVTMSVTVLNSGGAITGATLIDNLPAGMVIANPANFSAGAGCGTPTANAAPGGSTFGYSNGQIPAQAGPTAGSCRVQVDVRVIGPTGAVPGSVATLDNTIAANTGYVGAEAGVGTVSNAQAGTRSIQVIKLTNLTVAKSFSPATIRMGETSTITITITNPNTSSPIQLSGTVGENLPANVTAVNTTPSVTCSAGGSPTTATNASASGTTGNTTITLPANTTIAGGGTCTITWQVRGNTDNGNGGTQTNTVPANSIPNSRGLTNPAATANINVQSPLLASKAFAPATARAGQVVQMTITLQNRSAAALSAVSFADPLPAAAGGGQMSVAGAASTSAGCSPAGTITAATGATSVTGSGIGIAAGATCTVTVPVTVNNDGTYNNTATNINYTSADPAVGGPRVAAPASATLTAFDQVTASKSAQDPRNPNNAAGSVAPGNRVVYRISINNYTPAALANVAVNDPLPVSGGAQVTFVNPPAPVFTGCTGTVASAGGAPNAQFTGITIPAGAGANPSICVIEFTAQVPNNWPAGTAITNTIPSANITQNGTPFLQGANPSASSPSLNRLVAAKSIAPATVFQGDTALVTITLTNNDYAAMTGAAVNDIAPGFFSGGAANGVQISNPANATTTCGGAPILTAVPGSTSFVASGLTIPARGSCAVSYRVRGLTPANYTNTVPAANIAATTTTALPTTVSPVAPISAPLAVTPVLNPSKSFSPNPVAANGGVSRVTVVLRNVGTTQLTGVRVADPLPAGMVVASPASASTSCAGSPAITANPGAATAILDGAIIQGGNQCLFQFDVRTTGAGSTVNTIPAGQITADGGIATTTPVTATLNTLAAPSLNLQKSFVPSALVSVGQVSRLTVTIQNTLVGAINLTNVGAVDNFPPGLIIGAVPSVVTTCPGGVVTGPPGATSLTLSGANLAAGASCTFSANVTLVAAGTANNTLPAGAVTNDQNVTNPAPFTANLTTQASLGVDKSFTPPAVAPNAPSQLKIRLLNSQAVALNNVSVTDNLPSGLVVATPSGAFTTCPGGTVATTATQVRMTGASLAAATTSATVCEVYVNVVSASAGSYTNTIPAGGATATDPQGGAVSNQSPADAVLQVRAPANVTKAFANANRLVGQPNRLTVTIANPNAVALSNAVLTDNLPAGVTVAPTPNAATTCASSIGATVAVTANPGANSFRLTGAQIPASGSCTFAVDVLSNSPGVYTNTIPAGALITDEGVSNAAPATSTFSTLDPPTLGKSFAPVQIGPGAVSRLSIDLRNSNASAITLSSPLVDNLPQSPGSMTVAPTPNVVATPITAGQTCAAAGITAAAGATSITIASGYVLPPGGCRIQVNVTATVVGTYNNTLAPGALQTNAGNNQLPGTGSVLVSNTSASIAGTVYRDSNNNGTIQPTDAPIAGQTVELLNSGGTVIATAITDSLGNYSFLDIPPGTYSVRQPNQPPGTANGITSPGTGGTGTPTVTPVTTSPSVISNIQVAGGQSSINNNFGEIVPSSIGGRVFSDPNNNGTFEAGDSGLGGVTVTLTGTNDLGQPVNLSVPTNPDGTYLFPNLRPGTYTVTEPTQPAGTGNGITTAGSTGGTPTPVGTVPSAISAITLPPATNSVNHNFAEIPVTTISGTVFNDRNRDGGQQGGATPEPGIAGVSVTLASGTVCPGTPVTGLAANPVLTDANGSYQFSGVQAGQTYVICETQPNGYGNSPVGAATGIIVPNVPIAGSVGNNFPETLGQISGAVYQDFTAATPANTNNGVRDAGEVGIVGVPVTISGTRADGQPFTSITVNTDASGNYTFPDLFPGTYTVTEGVVPAGSGTFNDGRDTAGPVNGGGTPGNSTTNDAISAIVLNAGAQSPNNNFGELPVAPITGTVYIDRNGDNALTAVDPGRIAGVTLQLFQGTTCTGTPVATTVTDSNGNYSFSGASTGFTYTICETQPAGYGNGNANGTAGSNQITITNLPSTGSANNNFGELAGSILGGVYLDANNDGTRQPADQGISGVTVTLTGTDVNGAAVTRTATTDANGNYSFVDLIAGNFSVTEQAAQPAAPGSGAPTINGRTTAGTIGGTSTGTATPVSASPSAVNAIVLPAAGNSVNNNFGEILPVSLSGTVYLDPNNNGVQNPGEAGISGVSIRITGTDDTGAAVDRTVVTGANGTYAAADLRPGTYTVSEPTQPPGTANGVTTAGPAGGTATPVGTTPSAVSGINLTTPGASAPNNNFGEIPSNSALLGRVWRDTNNNGLTDTGESGLAGVTIELTGTDLAGQPVTRTTTTDANGNYTFDALPPGTYAVREPNQPVGTLNGVTVPGSTGGTGTAPGITPSAISGITLGVNQTSTNNNFGEIPPASITGAVYNDPNNNGARDGGETGFAGQTINLTGTDDLGNPVTATATTDANGNYVFPDLRPGTYVVTQPAQPTGTVNGITTPGSTGGTASPVGTTPSAISAIPLTVGQTSSGNNFAELGNSPDLVITKINTPATFTELNAGTYIITVRNIGQVPTNGSYTVRDRLPAGMTLAATPTGTGWTCTGAVGATSLSCSASTVIANGQNSADPITVRVNVADGVAANSPVNNVVLVEGGGELPSRGPSAAELAAFNGDPSTLPVCADPANTNVCRRPTPVQQSGGIAGRVWLDTNHDRIYQPGSDILRSGFVVEVRRGGTGDCASGELVNTSTTNAAGEYTVRGLIPSIAGDASTQYSVCFRDPVTGAYYGRPVSRDPAGGNDPTASGAAGVVGSGAIRNVSVPGGNAVRVNQDLPLDPNGVVYDSQTRQPVPGAIAEFLGPNGQIVPSTCMIGGVNRVVTAVGQAGTVDGGYSFLLINPPPAGCPGAGNYTVRITPPPGYVNAGTPSDGSPTFTSGAIPAQTSALAIPAACQGFVAGAPCAVQQQNTAPTGNQPTPYYFTLPINPAAPVDIVNNHIPLDPLSPTALIITKVAGKQTVELGDPVTYTIAVRNLSAGPVPNVRVEDSLPAGFRYIPGTYRLNGALQADPAGGVGPRLTFNVGAVAPNTLQTLTYIVRVGVGAQQGDGVNTAQAFGGPNATSRAVASNIARAKVKFTAGVFTTEACVIGKVYVDCNNNHVHDPEELGIPGVRLYFEDGTALVSDVEGKYSYCGLTPRTHVLKVDPLTLPRGARLTTTSSRNAGDAGSLFLDLKNGELHRADFAEGSCSNTVLEQVKSRKAQGEVRAVETEKQTGPALKFEGKAPAYPQQGTDSADQPPVKPREPAPGTTKPVTPSVDENDTPVPQIPAASQNSQRK
jgi:large repetitive protein